MKEITIDKMVLITLSVAALLSFAGMVAVGFLLDSERQKVAELEVQIAESTVVVEQVRETLCTLLVLDMYEFDTWHIDKYSDYTLRVTKGNIYLLFDDLESISDVGKKAEEAYQTFKVINEKSQ